MLQFRLKPQAVFSRDGDRFQQQRLLLHSNQRRMGVTQFREMGQQPINAFASIRLFQHVIANEVVELLNVFNGDRLIEDLHRL